MKESLTRQRAQHIWMKLGDGKVTSDLVTVSKSFPALVRGQGLAQAVALRYDRASGGGSGRRGTENRILLNLLEDWLVNQCPLKPFKDVNLPNPRETRLLGVCINASRGQYLIAQAEAIAYLEQVKLVLSAIGGS